MTSPSEAPPGYKLFFLNLLSFFGVDAITTGEINYQKYGYYYFHEVGINAKVIGIILILLSIYLAYSYHKTINKKVIELIKSEQWLILVPLCWLWFAGFSFIKNFLFDLNSFVFIGSAILNLLLSIKYHLKVREIAN